MSDKAESADRGPLAYRVTCEDHALDVILTEHSRKGARLVTVARYNGEWHVFFESRIEVVIR